MPAAKEQFLSALNEAMKQAAARRPKMVEGVSDQFVYLYCDGTGNWHVAKEDTDIPDKLCWNTEGFLIVYADGRIGITTLRGN